MQIQTFTGGIFDTNCFFLPESGILIDAPQDAADWLKAQGFRVRLLLLTHGHIDHVWDAARIQREQACRVGYHPETEPMITEPDFFRKFGFGWDITPITPGFTIREGLAQEFDGTPFDVLEVPGHCPGSLCFFHRESGMLFGGDVLFAGGVGRWDLPGGDYELLMEGIRKKVMALPDDTTVLPGHGPATKVGVERRTNPFLLRTAG